MKVHRFIGDFDLSKKKITSEDRNIINQLKNVLRLKAGDAIVLGDGKGNEADTNITTLHNSLVEFSVGAVRAIENEPPVDGILYCAVLKNENFETVVQKATEIGVKRIQPIITERTVKTNLRMDRLQKIAREAAEQSGRAVLPVISEPISFTEAAKEAINNDGNFFFDPTVRREHPHDVRIVDTAGIFIGPEGGWTDKERDIAEHYRFHFMSLGKLVLRGETAAIIATYLALYGSALE